MRHATAETIARIAPLLGEIRALGGLIEKGPGIFYRKSRAFLHFHEEGECVFADIRISEPDFTRLPADTSAERRKLLAAIGAALGE